MSTLGEATNFSGATWRKSAKTQANGQCVEVARMGEIIGVRDSKDPSGPILAFTRGAGQPPGSVDVARSLPSIMGRHAWRTGATQEHLESTVDKS